MTIFVNGQPCSLKTRFLSGAANGMAVIEYGQDLVLKVRGDDLRPLNAPAPVAAPAERDPWVDTRIVRFDDTIVFGNGGFDFDRWESLRWEMHTRHGSFAVWKSGDKTWSMYGGKHGILALDRFSCEAHAKAEAEQIVLSMDGEPVAPAPESEVERLRARVAQLEHGLTRCVDRLKSHVHGQYDGVWGGEDFDVEYGEFEAILTAAAPPCPPGHIMIGDRAVPEPMREAPEAGQRYWIVTTTFPSLACSSGWQNDVDDRRLLSRGLIHSTEANARAHAEAIIALSAGEGV